MFEILSPYTMMTDDLRRQHERDLQNDFQLVWRLTR